jgi:hypothetical protein
LKYQPPFDLQLSSFSRDSRVTSVEKIHCPATTERDETRILSSDVQEEGEVDKEEEEEEENEKDEEERRSSNLSDDLDQVFLNTSLAQEGHDEDGVEREDLGDFSDSDSILEPLADDDFHRSNEFSSSVMILSRVIFKMTSDHIYSCYESQLLTNLALPFLQAIQKIKILFDSNDENLKFIQTSELCSEVLVESCPLI